LRTLELEFKGKSDYLGKIRRDLREIEGLMGLKKSVLQKKKERCSSRLVGVLWDCNYFKKGAEEGLGVGEEEWKKKLNLRTKGNYSVRGGF